MFYSLFMAATRPDGPGMKQCTHRPPFCLPALLFSRQVPLWSRIGRLKRSSFPKLTGGGHSFGGGASPGVISSVAGRLLCDTYLIARELVGDCFFPGGR